MYLRHIRVRKKRKVHTYWALVRSVRQGTKVRQELVASLGELDEAGRLKARKLAQHITGLDQPGQLEFWEAADETVQVQLKGVRLERSRGFGDVWLGQVLWKALHFDELLAKLIPPGEEEVPWPAVLATLVIARLCAPCSELRIAEQWFRQTALDDLLGIPEERMNDDRLYRALDVGLALKDDLERHTRQRLGELFQPAYEILLYDLTSTYFEGAALGNPLALRGHSRDQRPDCKQVNIALVATKEGLPLAHEVFPGNTSDVKTVQDIVRRIETKFGKAERIWIMDRGMVSAEVLAWLRAENRPYIVGTPKCDLKKFEQALLKQDDWREVREGLEVKTCPSPEAGTETFILCRSQARREKERAMRARFADKIETGLRRIQNRLAHAKKPVNRDQTATQIGRLLQRNTRGAKCFETKLIEQLEQKAGFTLQWERRTQVDEWAALADGCYLLRANRVDWSAPDLWRAYIQLTDVEAAFRIHKSELEIRPVWHHTADRVRAHILICFLAYVLWKTLEQWSDRAGLGRSPRKLLDEFSQIKSVDAVLPTTDGRELNLRCVTRPEEPLQILLDRLGLELPRRLRPPACLAKAPPVPLAPITQM